jgi:hypothetical protein
VGVGAFSVDVCAVTVVLLNRVIFWECSSLKVEIASASSRGRKLQEILPLYFLN